MKKCLFVTLLFAIVSLPPVLMYGEEHQGHKSKNNPDASAAVKAEQPPVYGVMPAPGTKVPVGNDYYFTYGFDKKPKLGTIILKIEVYTKDGKRDTSLEMTADSGMPAMKGAHETGDQPFRLSKKGDYLLPINIVMPGGWEILLTIRKNGKVIYRGSHQFDV